MRPSLFARRTIVLRRAEIHRPSWRRRSRRKNAGALGARPRRRRRRAPGGGAGARAGRRRAEARASGRGDFSDFTVGFGDDYQFYYDSYADNLNRDSDGVVKPLANMNANPPTILTKFADAAGIATFEEGEISFDLQ